jgi:hypothetical protein
MKPRFKTLARWSLVCLAVAFSAGALFNWYLKRDDDKIRKQLLPIAAADNETSFLEVKVTTPEDLLAALEKPDRFRVMYRVSDIPNSVKIAFSKAIQKSTQDDVFSMAEPGAWPWNATDVIRKGLPSRRLKAVAVSDSLCLVFYEHGGFAKSDDLAAFRLSNDGVRAIWHSSFAPDVVNPMALRNTIRARAYGDILY